MENWLAKSILLGAAIFAAVVIYRTALGLILKKSKCYKIRDDNKDRKETIKDKE